MSKKQHGVITIEDIIQTCQTNPYFLRGFIAADESWVFHYKPEINCHGMEHKQNHE
jgi:hypothetical protein